MTTTPAQSVALSEKLFADSKAILESDQRDREARIIAIQCAVTFSSGLPTNTSNVLSNAAEFEQYIKHGQSV